MGKHGFTKRLNSMEMNLLSILYTIQRMVPVVKFATGLVGVAIAISIIRYFVGDTQAAVRIFGMTLVGMVLLIILTVMERTSESAQMAAKILMYIVAGALGVLVLMTVSIFAFEWPCAWMRFLGVADQSVCETGRTLNPESRLGDPLAVRPKNKSPGL